MTTHESVFLKLYPKKWIKYAATASFLLILWFGISTLIKSGSYSAFVLLGIWSLGFGQIYFREAIGITTNSESYTCQLRHNRVREINKRDFISLGDDLIKFKGNTFDRQLIENFDELKIFIANSLAMKMADQTSAAEIIIRAGKANEKEEKLVNFISFVAVFIAMYMLAQRDVRFDKSQYWNFLSLPIFMLAVRYAALLVINKIKQKHNNQQNKQQ